MSEGEKRRPWRSWRNIVGMISGVGTLAAIFAGRVASVPMVVGVSLVAVVLIGFSTIYQVDSVPRDKSPEALAREKSGLPAARGQGTAAPSVLVSFHPNDRAWARWITRQLGDCGYAAHADQWPAGPEHANGSPAADGAPAGAAGEESARAAREQIRDSDCVLFLVSRAGMAARADGHWWEKAITDPPGGRREAGQDGPVVLPTLIEPCDMDAATSGRIVIDLTDLDAEGCKEELVERLRAHQFPAPVPQASTTEFPLPGRGPVISNLRASDASFVGRRDEIDSIYALLHPARDVRTAPSLDLRAVVVHGLGGIGKTELVLQYAWEHADEYDLIWWVQAGTPVSAINDLIDLAKTLNLVERANHDEIVISLWSALRQRDRWLLVFDDVDEPESIFASYWPPLKRGHALVTSRAASGWESLTSRALQLTALTPEEAEDFLTRRIPEAATDPRSMRQVAESLDYLPLTLVQAATYIREAGTTLSAFRDLLRDQFDEVIEASQRKTNEVAGGYSLLLMLSAQNRAPAARDLLALLSMFGSTNIPRRIITQHANVLPPQLCATMADQLAHDRTVRELSRFSLIEAFTDRFNVHSVVQSTVRSALPVDEQRLWCRVAVRLLRRAFPRYPEEPSAWSTCAFLMPHVEAVTQIAERLDESDERMAHLLLLAGIYLHGRCDWRQAQEYLRTALHIRKRLFGENDLSVAECLYHLGQSQFPLAQLEQAKASAEHALEIRERLLEPVHPLIAEALTRLAEILRESATENDRAVACTERAESILRNVGANEAGIADTLLIRGTILRNAGRIGEALRAQQQSLALNEQVRANGPSSLEAAMNHANIGVIYRDLGQWERARDEFEIAITIMEPTLGDEHLEVAQAKKYLGDIFWRTGELEAAHRLLAQVTEIHRRRPGEEHKLAACLAKMGSIQLASGDTSRAKESLETAHGIYVHTYHDQHPYVAKVLSRLAPVYLALGRDQEAENTLLRAQDILEASYGRFHPALAWVFQSLSEVSQARGDRETADMLRARVGLIRRRAAE
jgi:tetratricopeptide (TPR) repeat protein